RPPDAAPPPMGCTLGPRQGPLADDAPTFVHSLAPYEDGFLVGWSGGWPPDLAGSFGRLDVGLTGFEDRAPITPGETVFAAPVTAEVAVLGEGNNVVHLARYGWARGTWERRDDRRLCDDCDDCVPSGPAVGGEGWLAFATEHFVGERAIEVAFQREEAFEPERGLRFEGEADAALSGNAATLWLVSSLEGEMRLRRLGWADGFVGDATPLPLTPNGVSAATRATPDGGVLVAGRADAEDDLAVLQVGPDGELGRSARVEVGDLVIDAALSRSRGTIAVAWEGLDGLGVTVLREDDLSVVLPATPVSGERPGSYRRTIAIAPAPYGHAIVYGGWEEDTYYGAYARRVDCRGF
ncbi:MAG TPA: hypothetical protein RMI62_17925, partial [Polyangiaceae bacterium LLY-WYZ-15_(1-7)]|nr:hypothetical protein [Polyangiaceae bacterium LLY-WYZ-15_(1-7)]